MDPKTAITFKNMKSFESFGNLIKGFNTRARAHFSHLRIWSATPATSART